MAKLMTIITVMFSVSCANAQTLSESFKLMSDSSYASTIRKKYGIQLEHRSPNQEPSKMVTFRGEMRFRIFLAYYQANRSGVVFLLDSANQWSKDFRKELATSDQWHPLELDQMRFDGTLLWAYKHCCQPAYVRAEILNIDEVRIELPTAHPNE